MKVYCYTFSDGYRVWVRGFSARELKNQEKEHGKLISKVQEG